MHVISRNLSNPCSECSNFSEKIKLINHKGTIEKCSASKVGLLPVTLTKFNSVASSFQEF